MHRAFAGGWGGVSLIGTPEQVAEMILRLRSLGYAGSATGWLDFEEGLGEFNEKVMPLLREAGIRRKEISVGGRA